MSRAMFIPTVAMALVIEPMPKVKCDMIFLDGSVTIIQMP